MKAISIFGVALAALMLVSVDALAQRASRRPADSRSQQQRLVERPVQRAERPVRAEREYCLMVPDLTEEQKEQLGQLRLEHLESSTLHRARMDELRAKMRRLNAERADQEEINSVIDEMTDLRNQQMKEGVQHRNDIRSALTEEQRAVYDRQTSLRGPSSRQAAVRGDRLRSPAGRGRR